MARIESTISSTWSEEDDHRVDGEDLSRPHRVRHRHHRRLGQRRPLRTWYTSCRGLACYSMRLGSIRRAQRRQSLETGSGCHGIMPPPGADKRYERTWMRMSRQWDACSLEARGVGGATVRKSSTKADLDRAAVRKGDVDKKSSHAVLEHGLGDLGVDAPVAVDLCGNQPSPRHRAGVVDGVRARTRPSTSCVVAKSTPTVMKVAASASVRPYLAMRNLRVCV